MGLLFQMPTSEQEDHHCLIQSDGITLFSYGLPSLFWGYYFAFLFICLTMYALVKDPIHKLMSGHDLINMVLGYSVLFVLLGLPAFCFATFFYSKKIRKSGRYLFISHRVFGVPFWGKKVELEGQDSLEVKHYLQSPNMARLHAKPDMKQFENQGYFELFAKTLDGKLVLVDRCSQKLEIRRFKELLDRY